MKKIICRNCGAKIDKNDVECPYCHAMQYDASEKKYMNDLYHLNDQVDQLDNQAMSFIRKQTVRYVLIAVAGIIVTLLIGAGLGYHHHIKTHESIKDQQKIASSYDWYDENIDTMNECVRTKDYKTASDLMHDYNGTYDLLQGWEHYGLISLYSYQYQNFDKYINELEQGKKLDEYAFGSCFDSAMEYLNTLTNKKDYNYARYKSASKEDQAVMESWVERIHTFMTEYVGIETEEYMADMKTLYFNGYPEYKVESEYEGKYYQKYKQTQHIESDD